MTTQLFVMTGIVAVFAILSIINLMNSNLHQ